MFLYFSCYHFSNFQCRAYFFFCVYVLGLLRLGWKFEVAFFFFVFFIFLYFQVWRDVSRLPSCTENHLAHFCLPGRPQATSRHLEIAGHGPVKPAGTSCASPVILDTSRGLTTWKWCSKASPLHLKSTHTCSAPRTECRPLLAAWKFLGWGPVRPIETFCASSMDIKC